MNRKSAPKITEAVNFTLNLKPYETLVLDNGVKVYTINEGPQDIIQIEIVFSAGNWFENKNGIAGTTNFMLKNGTTQKTALQINEAFEYYGTFCSRHCYNETATLSLHTLTKYLHHLLPVMQELISDSVFPENELELFKQNSLQKLTVNLRNAEFVAGRLIDSYVYGENHPYGIYTRPDTLEQLTVEELKLFYNQYYLNGEAVLFVSGNLPENIFELLNNNFGKLSLKPATLHYPAKVATPSIVKKYRIENDKTSVQGAIRLAQPFPNRHHPDFKKVMLLNCLFGGFFGSRLMSNIREDKGFTYGIYSYIQNHLQQSAWLISTEAGKDVCEATISEVYKEMKALTQKHVGKDELLLVKNYMMGTILGDLNGPFQIMGRWKNIILNQLDETYFYDSVKAIKETTAEELMELSKKYLSPEQFYELVVY